MAEEGNIEWRPPIFPTLKALEDKINEFRQFCKENSKPMTIERLAFICWCDRDTILNYWNKEEFFGTISKIRSEILAEKVERLNDKENYTPWIVFDLKNNHKYIEKQEIDQRNLNIDTTPKELATMTDEELQALLK